MKKQNWFTHWNWKILRAKDTLKRMLMMKYTKKYNIEISSLNESFESLKVFKSEIANEIIGKALISLGGLTGTVVDNRIVFKYAVDCLATSIILAHNHPSGQLKPSEQDIRITKKIVEIGRLFEIEVLDHLIVTENNFYSFADNGLIN